MGDAMRMGTARKRIDELAARIAAAWCAETSACPERWSPENPSLGQCAATAAVIREELGGIVVWALAELPDGTVDGHYWNRFGSEDEDRTRGQFPPGTRIPPGGPRHPWAGDAYAYVTSFPATAARVALLRERAGLPPRGRADA
jgi:hypothetical protein